MHKIFNYPIIIAAAALSFAVSCTNLESMNARIDKLENRVGALENVVNALNTNVEALQEIASIGAEGSQKFISSVVETEDKYILTLSDGSTIELVQGSVGIGKAPILTIDEEGYWLIDQQDGSGPHHLLYDSSKPDEPYNRVIAAGENGITPVFGVDSEGYWTVQYGEAEPQRVLDENGQPVKAVSSEQTEDSYFASVEIDNNYLILTLKDLYHTQYKVPIVNDFYFKIIVTSESDLVFDKYGEKKQFSVESKGVAAQAVTAPEGWSAWIQGSSLFVQAPEASATKASADTRTDVAVIATSESGLVSISKIKVRMSDDPGYADDPTASIRLTAAGATTLTFEVAVENTVRWFYMLRKQGDTKPLNSEMIASGTLGTDAPIEITDLTAETSYVLYVLPLDEEDQGVITSYTATTTAYSDRYDAYCGGNDIIVGGYAFNKSTYGAATHVSGQQTVNAEAGKIFFVDEGAAVNFTGTSYAGNIIIIGNHPDQRADVVFTAPSSFGPGEVEDHMMVFSNVNVSFNAISSTTRQILPISTGKVQLGRIIFDDCKVTFGETLMMGVNGNNNGLMFKELSVLNSDVLITSKACFFDTWNGADYELGIVRFINNVVWSKETDANLQFRFLDASYASGVPVSSITIKNNTFYNVHTGMHQPDYLDHCTFGINKVLDGGCLVLTNNLAYTSRDQTAGEESFGFVRLWGVTLAGLPDVPGFSAGDNWVNFTYTTPFRASDGNDWTTTYMTKGTGNPFASEDIENGVFIQSSDYSKYGATRK